MGTEPFAACEAGVPRPALRIGAIHALEEEQHVDSQLTPVSSPPMLFAAQAR